MRTLINRAYERGFSRYTCIGPGPSEPRKDMLISEGPHSFSHTCFIFIFIFSFLYLQPSLVYFEKIFHVKYTQISELCLLIITHIYILTSPNAIISGECYLRYCFTFCPTKLFNIYMLPEWVSFSIPEGFHKIYVRFIKQLFDILTWKAVDQILLTIKHLSALTDYDCFCFE